MLQEAGPGRPEVEAVVYPHPDYEGRPWSQWGQGLVLPDGRFLSAIGDHLGAEGNSYLYEYDPTSHTLSLLADVASLAEEPVGAYGHGKIHARLVGGRCGVVYFSTYWGVQPQPEEQEAYGGDLLFAFDANGRTAEELGTPVPDHGIPSLTGWRKGGLLYGETVDSHVDIRAGKRGTFFVYDTVRREVIFRDDDSAHTGFQHVIVDARGRAYYSVGEGVLAVYDPETGHVRQHPETLPGKWAQASTAPAPDGTVYGITADPYSFFALEPSGEIRSIGSAPSYTASLALDKDGDRFFYVPGAHGDAWRYGTPLIAVDTQQGDQTVVVELNPLAEERLGLRLGGTYNVVIDPSGRTVYLGMNAGPSGTEDPFGEVVLVIVHLP